MMGLQFNLLHISSIDQKQTRSLVFIQAYLSLVKLSPFLKAIYQLHVLFIDIYTNLLTSMKLETDES